MSAWCDVWYETQDYQVACDSFFLSLSRVPQKILAFQLSQQDVSGQNKRFHIPGSFPENPSLTRFDLTAPGFERIGQAFDNLHGISNISRKNVETPVINSLVQTKTEQSLMSIIFNIASSGFRRPIMLTPSAAGSIPRLDPAQATTKSGSHQSNVSQNNTFSEPPTQKLCFVVCKRTAKEKLMSLDKLKLSNYVRSFDVQWNDIDDILEGEVVSCENDLPIISRLLVKGKDWSWRWIPAECVNQQLIQTYLKGRGDESTGDTLPITALGSTGYLSAEDDMVFYTVRQALRAGYPFRETGILDVARFINLKDANKCAKCHFKTLCTPKTIKKVRKYRFGDMFFGSVANNDWKEEDIIIWVEKETRKHAALGTVIQGLECAKSSVDNIFNTVANLSDIEPSSSDVLGAHSKDNQAETTPSATPLGQRLRDGRDFFKSVDAKKLHIDAGTLSGSLKKRESLSPYEYFALLEKRMNLIWRDWIKHWETKATQQSFEEKLQKETNTIPDSGEDASSKLSTSVHLLESAHEVKNGGPSVEVAESDNLYALVDTEYPDIGKGQDHDEDVKDAVETENFPVEDEPKDDGAYEESEDDAIPILKLSSIVFGEGSKVAEDTLKSNKFSEVSEDDTGPILTPSTSIFGEGSVVTDDELVDGESSGETGDDRSTILTPSSSIFGDGIVVSGEGGEEERLSGDSDEGVSLVLTPNSSVFGDFEYLD